MVTNDQTASGSSMWLLCCFIFIHIVKSRQSTFDEQLSFGDLTRTMCNNLIILHISSAGRGLFWSWAHVCPTLG